MSKTEEFKTLVKAICEHLVIENKLLQQGKLREYSKLGNEKTLLVNHLSEILEVTPELIANPSVKINLQRAASLIEVNSTYLKTMRNGVIAAQSRIDQINSFGVNLGAYDRTGQSLRIHPQKKNTKTV